MLNFLQDARESLAAEEKALAQLSQRLDHSFTEVVELILACEGRLVIGGIGKSGLIGKKMVATFASTGTPSFFLHPTEAFHGDLGMLKPMDVVMLISYSGESDDVNKLIPSLKNFGNKIIALTSNKNSTLARHSDYMLDITVEREVCPNNLAPTTSALVTLALGDALAVALIKARHFQPEDFARFHPGGSLGRRLLCRVKDQMQTCLPITALSTSFTDCLTVMNEGRMGVALVMENDQLKGIITDGDIRRALTANGAETLNKTARELMTSNPKTIRQDAYLAEAENLMKELKIHSLIALDDDNKVVGLIEFSS
ncbi:KpsF/GutQ family sugar isomerase [Pasteurellaceae bacterium LIM206]|nr:KpsF/GutQ family sugar isomerase [Pasteurellaceae bacterium LIM206]